jgi:hypothetical protein
MIALAIAFALLVLYLLWLLLRSYWAPVLLFSHLVIGCIFLAAFLLTQRSASRSLTTDAMLRLAAEVSSQAQASRIRLIATKVFGAVNVLTGGWPMGLYAVISGLSRPNSLNMTQIQAHESLQGKSHKLGPVVLGLVIFVYLFAWLQPSTIYWGRIFLAILALNTIARHLTYAVHPLSLPTQLRRTVGSAYLTFVMIAISDLCVLVLTFNAIENWGGGTIGSLAEGSLEDLKGIVSALFFGHTYELLSKIASGYTPAVKEVLLPSVGALYSYNLLETAYKFGDFKRNDADFMAVAQANTILGKYNDALGMLAQVKDKGGTWYGSRSIAYLGVLQVNKAWEDIKQSLIVKRMDNENRDITKEDIFLEGFGHSIMANLPTEARIAWLRHGIDSNLGDLFVACGLNTMVFGKSEIPSAETIFNTTAVAAAYPLSNVVLLISARDSDVAKANLDQIHPTGLSQTLFHQLLILQVNLFDSKTSEEQDSLYFSNWSASTLKLLTEIDWKSLTTADLNVIMFCITTCHSFAGGFKSAYLQSWMYHSTEVKKHLPLSSIENKFLERLELSMNEAAR